MPKSLSGILIALGLGYLLIKQFPSVSGGLATSPLIRPITNNLSPAVAITGVATGLLGTISKLLSTPTVATQTPKTATASTVLPIAPPANSAGFVFNGFEQIVLGQGTQPPPIVPTLPAQTYVADPPAFSLPDPSSATFSSIFGSPLPVAPPTFDDSILVGDFSTSDASIAG